LTPYFIDFIISCLSKTSHISHFLKKTTPQYKNPNNQRGIFLSNPISISADTTYPFFSSFICLLLLPVGVGHTWTPRRLTLGQCVGQHLDTMSVEMWTL